MTAKEMFEKAGYRFEVIKNSTFCIVIALFIVFIPIVVITLGRYSKQVDEIDKLNKQIENQQVLIDYLNSKGE